MRPLHLKIEGLRSFRAPVTLDFAGRDHIAIVGDTGAGKSSILEAMTWALYGRTTFSAQGKQELMNDTSRAMRVVLRFGLSGETWEIVRGARRSKAGRVGAVWAQLTRIGEDGEPEERIEQVRLVKQRVEALIGLDGEAFLRTVILPQGRFARLLVEDKPGARSKILRQVWRTDELEAAGQRATEALRTAEAIRIRLEQEADASPEDPDAHLAELRRALEAARAQVEVTGSAASEAEEAADALERAQAKGATAAAVRRRLGSVDLDAIATGLAPLARRAADLDQEERELDRGREALEAERDRIPTTDGPTVQQVATALSKLDGLGHFIEAAERAAAELRSGRKRASEQRAAEAGVAAKAARARKASEEHAPGRAPLENAAREARNRRNEVERLHAAAEDRSLELRGGRRRLDGLQQQVRRAEADFAAAEERAARAKRKADEADECLAAAQRSDAAAHAAHGLAPGDCCPVCERDLPGGWIPPPGEDIEAAAGLLREARRLASAGERRRERLRGELGGARNQAAEAKLSATAFTTRLAEARRRLAAVAGGDPDGPLPGRDVLLAPLDEQRKRADSALADHNRVAEGLLREARARETEAQLARQAVVSADSATAKSHRSAIRHREALAAAIGAIPGDFRPTLALPAEPADLREVDRAPVEQTREAARARQAALRKREQKLARLAARIAETERGLRKLAERRRSQIIGPLVAFRRRLGQDRDALVASASPVGLAREVPHPAGGEPPALLAHARDLATLLEGIENAASALAEEGAREEAMVRARVRELGEPSGDPASLLGRARRQAEEARHQQRTARREVERFAAVADDIRRLRELLDEAQRREWALRDLSEALKPGRFLKWLTLRRSKELLIHASRKLGEVSGGRYSFVDPQEVDERWSVLDNDSGEPRTPATLSGGEQFLASLSLALGMVEMMERTGGRLEALFLDEGFGSLDARSLDAAIAALETAAAHRMVAVISHIRAVAEQVDDVLAVTRESTGSQVRWLSRADRERWATKEVGLDALALSDEAESAAVNGLLD